MGFHDVRLNDVTEVDFGTRSAPNFSVSVIVNDAGHEERVARWTDPKREYEADFGRRKRYQLYSVIEFYIARQGPTHSFRFKDWADYATTSTGNTHLGDSSGTVQAVTNADVVLGTGDGTETQFQMFKEYVSGSITRTRNLYKLVSGTVLVAVAGVAQTEGSDYTVNYVTGVITFTSAPAVAADVTAGCEFDVEVRFGEDTNLDTTLDNFATASTAISLVEIRNQEPNPEEAFHGGAKDHGTISANIAITLAEGRVHVFDPDTSGLVVILPAEDSVEPGGPLFVLVNDGGFDLELQRDDFVKLVDIPAGQIVQVWMSDGASGRTWIVTRA